MREERHWIPSGGEKLAAVLTLPDKGRGPCVIACHGLAASKDSEKYLLLTEAALEAGLACCRFDFRGCGESGGRYADSTVAGRIADLRAVIAFLRGHPDLDGRLALVGSSMGGFVALHVAAADPSIRGVVTWNTPATLRGMGGSGREADLEGLGVPFREELEQGDLLDAAAGVGRALVIQGTEDEVVPPEHGRLLYERSAEPKSILMLEGAAHRLTDPAHRRRAIHASLSWLLPHL